MERVAPAPAATATAPFPPSPVASSKTPVTVPVPVMLPRRDCMKRKTDLRRGVPPSPPTPPAAEAAAPAHTAAASSADALERRDASGWNMEKMEYVDWRRGFLVGGGATSSYATATAASSSLELEVTASGPGSASMLADLAATSDALLRFSSSTFSSAGFSTSSKSFRVDSSSRGVLKRRKVRKIDPDRDFRRPRRISVLRSRRISVGFMRFRCFPNDPERSGS
mmetsp:Transcript_54878/g.164263  ORF Transcript_54878/g.164263 Transcript_54878/m.164263 type:complete len:224 (-) Transcript_54878:3647-4318(-)